MAAAAGYIALVIAVRGSQRIAESALGVGLMVWIVVQVLLMPFHPLQPIMFAIGTVEGLVALLWIRRLGFIRA